MATIKIDRIKLCDTDPKHDNIIITTNGGHEIFVYWMDGRLTINNCKAMEQTVELTPNGWKLVKQNSEEV